MSKQKIINGLKSGFDLHVLYEQTNGQIVKVSLQNGEEHEVISNSSFIRLNRNGHLKLKKSVNPWHEVYTSVEAVN